MAPSPGTNSKPNSDCPSRRPDVTYSIDIDPQAQWSITTLPTDALATERHPRPAGAAATPQ